MCGDVARRQQTFTVTPEIYGFVAKSRKGGEAPQNADENEGARFGGEDPAALGELREKPNGQAAKQIDHQRAVGKIDAATQTLHEAADTRQKKFTHTNDSSPEFGRSHQPGRRLMADSIASCQRCQNRER